MNALELQKVYLRRGNFILHDIHFSVREGSIVAVSGRSGAGKSTLIRLIGNALVPDAGRILYYGKEMYEDEIQIRRRLSVVYDVPNFNVEMKAGRLAKEIRKFEPWFDMDGFRRRMEIAGLDDTKRIKLYSRGMQKKYMLILALCRLPDLLVMDEPTSGVDELSREEMFRMIGEYQGEHPLTILFSTHNEDDIQQYADRVLVLDNGGLK